MFFFFLFSILFFATFIRSAFGFGEALIAVPLLAFILPVSLAVPLAVLISITVSIFTLVQDHRHVMWRSMNILFLTTLVGIPVGLWLLVVAPESLIKQILGMTIILFSSYLLIQKGKRGLHTERAAPFFGFLAGILGGAYGMNGPPLVAYGTLRRWSPQQFRATLQGYFLPSSIVVMIGYAVTGLWTMEVNYYYIITLPIVILAIVSGRIANRYFNERTFISCVHAGLILIGLGLLWQSGYGSAYFKSSEKRFLNLGDRTEFRTCSCVETPSFNENIPLIVFLKTDWLSEPFKYYR